MHHKTHLPEKICPVCGFPFKWRKKWRNSWSTVIYCSQRCQRNKSATGNTDTDKS